MKRKNVNGIDYVVYEIKGVKFGYPVAKRTDYECDFDISYILCQDLTLYDLETRLAAYLSASILAEDSKYRDVMVRELLKPIFKEKVYDDKNHNKVLHAIKMVIKKHKLYDTSLFGDAPSAEEFSTFLQCFELAAIWRGGKYQDIITVIKSLKKVEPEKFDKILENYLKSLLLF